jgi:hypothetical protein
MTPFEQAQKNIRKLADGLAMMSLVAKTLEETENMSEEINEVVWHAFFSLLEATGKLGDAN